MKIYKSLFFALVAILFSSTLVLGQQQVQERSFDFDPDLTYESLIPSPQEFLGYEMGQEYMPHHNIMDYFEMLAEVPGRLTFHK